MNDEAKRLLHEIEDLLLRARDWVRSEPASPDTTKKIELALLDALDCVRLARQRGEWPEPTVDPPDMATIEEWLWDDGGCEATDSCWVEVDGVCPHNHPSWLLKLGLI